MRFKLYLLQDRMESYSRKGPLEAAAIIRFRPYLGVLREDHRTSHPESGFAAVTS